MKEQFGYVYITYKPTTGEFYIGKRKFERERDTKYFGSGKWVREELSKGSVLVNEVLSYHNTLAELNTAEKDYIEMHKSNLLCRNIARGGDGGLIVDQYHFRDVVIKKKEDPEWLRWYKKRVSEGLKKRFKNTEGTFKGKKHKPETILKMKESSKGKGKGTKNSQYGSFWITDSKVNLKVKAGSKIPEGYNKGRKLKN
jgi:hypothetical protein